MTNTLYLGDNLAVLREHIADGSVDLIYLDPPFDSNRSYDVLFKDSTGLAADSQITAFDDTWHWGRVPSCSPTMASTHPFCPLSPRSPQPRALQRRFSHH